MSESMDILQIARHRLAIEAPRTRASHEKLIELLTFLWKSILTGIGRDWQHYTDSEAIFDNLIEPVMEAFYSPRVVKKSKTQILDCQPSDDDKKIRKWRAELELATELNLVEILDTGIDRKPLITPEGMVLCASLKAAKLHQLLVIDEYVLSTLGSRLHDKYRSLIFEKVRQLNIAGSKLTTKEMGLIVFLIYNGNIGEAHSLRVTSDDLRSIVASCVSSFELDTKTKRASSTLLDRILPHIQRKMGYPIYNEQSTYYIQEDKLGDLVRRLQRGKSGSSWDEDLHLRWSSFRREYENHTPALRALRNYHFSPRNRRYIEARIIEGAEELEF